MTAFPAGTTTTTSARALRARRASASQPLEVCARLAATDCDDWGSVGTEQGAPGMTEASISAKRKRGSHAGGSADATPDLQRARIAGDGESPSLKTAEDVELAAFTRSLQPELNKPGDATTRAFRICTATILCAL